MNEVPPGWYPDPYGAPDLLRWWDGGQWTGETAPAVAEPPIATEASWGEQPQWQEQEPTPPATGGGQTTDTFTSWPQQARPAVEQLPPDAYTPWPWQDAGPEPGAGADAGLPPDPYGDWPGQEQVPPYEPGAQWPSGGEPAGG